MDLTPEQAAAIMDALLKELRRVAQYPDTPALRGLLESIDDILSVPHAAHQCDDDLELAELTARAKSVHLAVKALLDGPFDNVAIQSYAGTLRTQVRPVGYQVRAA